MIGTVVDIETTGFLKFDTDEHGFSRLSDNSEILEVGFITIDMSTARILNHGELYFYKPYFNIESDAQRIHGLTRDFLKQYEQDFEKNLIALNSLIQSTCIIGKNSDKFDMPFIKAFIDKHAGPKFNIPEVVSTLNMKAYSNGYVEYPDRSYAMDLQVLFKNKYHELYYDKYHVSLASNKRGTLTDYIDVIPDAQEATDAIYAGFSKTRVTGAHGALYDATMTLVVWMYMFINKMF
jgi:DNA polymerase elongation subunit (family B)